MTLKRILGASLALTALAACDQLLEEEGAPAPMPEMPEFRPVEDAWGADPLDTPTPTPTADTGSDESASVASGVTSLADINAVACPSVPIDTETVTIAEAAGATEAVARGSNAVAAVVPGTIGAAGLSAFLSDYPGIVKMEPRRIEEEGIASGHCGATRIDRHWFVTAAHCLDSNYDETVLKVGHEDLDTPVIQEVKSTFAICHAAYGGRSDNLSNDIALVRISEDSAVALDNLNVPNAHLVDPTDIITPSQDPDARLAGWGMTSPGGRLSNTLLGTNVEIKSVGPALIRVASIDGSGPCIGDSGGPLFVTNQDGDPVLTGVLSGVEQAPGSTVCAGDYTARYTNLQGFTGWITNVKATCEANDGMCGTAVVTASDDEDPS